MTLGAGSIGASIVGGGLTAVENVPVGGGVTAPGVVAGTLTAGDALPYAGELRPEGRALRALLPKGIAWTRDLNTNLAALIDALAEEFAIAEQAINDLPREFLPGTAVKFIQDWKDALGWVGDLPTTLSEQQHVLAQKFLAQGRQDRAFWIGLAAALGYTITISEYRPFRAGESDCTDALTQSQWIHTWDITTASGDKDDLLVTSIVQLNAEHTLVRFNFT